MIVVTGSLRTGTSLVIDILRELGCVPAAPKYNDDNKPVADQNKSGFYEFPEWVIKGGLNTDQYKGQVVKLFSYYLALTKPQYVSKVIICKRDSIDNAVKSHQKLVKKLTGAVVSEKHSRKMYEEAQMFAFAYAEQNDIPHTVVVFEELLGNTETVVRGLAEFVGMQYRPSAVAIVEKR